MEGTNLPVFRAGGRGGHPFAGTFLQAWDTPGFVIQVHLKAAGGLILAIWNGPQGHPGSQAISLSAKRRRILNHQHCQGSLSTLLSLSTWAAWAAANLCACLEAPWVGLGFGCGSCARTAHGEARGEYSFFSTLLNMF